MYEESYPRIFIDVTGEAGSPRGELAAPSLENLFAGRVNLDNDALAARCDSLARSLALLNLQTPVEPTVAEVERRIGGDLMAYIHAGEAVSGAS